MAACDCVWQVAACDCSLAVVSRSQTLDGKVIIESGTDAAVDLSIWNADVVIHADNQRKRSCSEPAI